jgi:hypothetical protein
MVVVFAYGFSIVIAAYAENLILSPLNDFTTSLKITWKYL